MTVVTHYDLIVIGTGSGNAIVDDDFAGQRVAIIEKGVFGGTCLNVGCIPTKMFVYPADLARDARHAPDLGVDTTFEQVRWPAIRDRVFGRIDPIASGGQDYREGLDNVDVYTEECHFVGERQVDTGSRGVITADQVVIAAGSRVQLPPIEGLDGVDFHTSDTVMRLEELPRRMVILGGGFVGAEFAHVFSAYGTEVTQVHRGSALLQREDEDVSGRFTEIAARQWDVRLNRLSDRVERTPDGIRVHLTGDGDQGPEKEYVECDVLLLATGRVPNSDTLALGKAGVDVDDAGVVVVDEYQRTSAPGVWALGDIANSYQLKHVANHEARVVQHNLLHPDDLVASDHAHVPHAVFSSPQVASVGQTEQALRESGTDYVVKVQDYADVAYGWAMEDSGHFVKLLADPDTHLLLGAHLIGPQASILIQPLIQAMELGTRVPELARGQYWIHPALTEVLENALLGLDLR